MILALIFFIVGALIGLYLQVYNIITERFAFYVLGFLTAFLYSLI